MPPVGELAFERAYRTQGTYVAHVLGRLAVPAESVSDAVQDVFVAAYRRWDDFDPDRPVRPWLTGFARRIAFRYRRSAARRHRKAAALVPVVRDHERPPNHRVDACDFLDRFLQELDEGHRRAFLLIELEGRTAVETAAVLGISSEAVYGRVRSVRRRLRQALLVEREPDPRAAALVPAWAVMKARLGLGVPTIAVPGIGPVSVAALKTFASTVGLGLLGLGLVAVARLDPGPPPEAMDPTPPAADDHGSRDAAARVAPLPAIAPTPEAPSSEPPAVAVTTAEPTRRASRPSAPPPEGSLAEETTLLRAAKTALAEGRAEAALTPLQEHARRFPQGQLADARHRTRIRALCDLGRVSQARGEARQLARTRPGDPLAQQALSICAEPSIRERAVAEKEGSR